VKDFAFHVLHCNYKGEFQRMSIPSASWQSKADAFVGSHVTVIRFIITQPELMIICLCLNVRRPVYIEKKHINISFSTTPQNECTITSETYEKKPRMPSLFQISEMEDTTVLKTE
jgi:hypothetical protein